MRERERRRRREQQRGRPWWRYRDRGEIVTHGEERCPQHPWWRQPCRWYRHKGGEGDQVGGAGAGSSRRVRGVRAYGSGRATGRSGGGGEGGGEGQSVGGSVSGIYGGRSHRAGKAKSQEPRSQG